MDWCVNWIKNGFKISNVRDPKIESRCIENVRGWEIKQKWWETEKIVDEDMVECKK